MTHSVGDRGSFRPQAGSIPSELDAAEVLSALGDCWGALNFILAFYEPGQRYLDTNAWTQAEAAGRRARARARAILDRAKADAADASDKLAGYGAPQGAECTQIQSATGEG